MQSLITRSESIGPSEVFHEHKSGLLDSQEYVGAFQSFLCPFIPQLFLLFRQPLVRSSWCHGLSTLHVKWLSLIIFNKCLSHKMFSLSELLAQSETSLLSGTFFKKLPERSNSDNSLGMRLSLGWPNPFCSLLCLQVFIAAMVARLLLSCGEGDGVGSLGQLKCHKAYCSHQDSPFFFLE